MGDSDSYLDEKKLPGRLKWKSYRILVQLLKGFNKFGKVLSIISLVSTEDTVETFPAVIWDPCKLSAVVV